MPRGSKSAVNADGASYTTRFIAIFILSSCLTFTRYVRYTSRPVLPHLQELQGVWEVSVPAVKPALPAGQEFVKIIQMEK